MKYINPQIKLKLSYEAKWIELQFIMLSKINQIKDYIFLHI